MSSPDLALYVTSNEVDHGPLSLKEATNRVQSGEFKPTDLAWHQGVSGWIPMKDLPEWDAMQAPPPIEKKAPPKLISDPPAPKIDLPAERNKPIQANRPSPSPLNQAVNNERGFQDNAPLAQQQGMGTGGKVLVAFAMLVFLGVLVFVGYILYAKVVLGDPPF
jgi:hypothetical protein